MGDTVWITAFVVIAIMVVMAIFKDRLKSFFFKADGEGIRAKIETGSSGVNIKGSKITGSDHHVKITRDNVNIEESEVSGKRHKIDVGQPSQK